MKFLDTNPKTRTFYFAAWLGWQAESNWTDPFLFTIYSIIRPIATTFLVILMYLFIVWIAGGGKFSEVMFNHMFVGAVFYMYIFNVVTGLSWLVQEEREHYQTLKYVYISPSDFYIYLFGRGFTKILVTTISVIITFIFAILVININFSLNFGLIIIGLFFGSVSFVSVGIAFAALSMIMPRGQGFIMESVAGIFYLLCGVLFPITVLPEPLKSSSLVIPFTYWFEMMRRGLTGRSADMLLTQIPELWLIAILALTSLWFLILSIVIYKYADRKTREMGSIDMQTWF